MYFSLTVNIAYTYLRKYYLGTTIPKFILQPQIRINFSNVQIIHFGKSVY